MRVVYITNAKQTSGVGYRAEVLAQLLLNQGLELCRVEIDGSKGIIRVDGAVKLRLNRGPGLLGKKPIMWIRLGRALSQILPPADVYHLTNQSLSFLAKKFSPTIVTVHDLIELVTPQQQLTFPLQRYLHSGITQADRIIAVSEYTAREIKRYYSSPPPITVLPNAVGKDFHPIEGFAESKSARKWRERLSLNQSDPIILTVGSAHPRKNIATALEAFAQVRSQFPQAVFIKVGSAGILSGQKHLEKKVAELKLGEQVRFIEQVNGRELNELYNLATVFIFTSRLEGFGLPPLQAMAAGTPVICSLSSALPGVVGQAALLAEPDDKNTFSTHLIKLLASASERERFVQLGLAQARKFSWEEAANGLTKIYRQLIN